MARAKPQFNRRPGDHDALRAVQRYLEPDQRVIKRLEGLYPAALSVCKSAAEDEAEGARGGNEPFATPARSFAQALLDQARWAWAMQDDERRRLTKEDERAEARAIRRHLAALHNMLQTMSPDLSARLAFDPRGLAESLASALADLDRVIALLPSEPRRPKSADRLHALAVELAVRVLRICRQYGLQIGATAGNMSAQPSPAVTILTIVGQQAGLPRSDSTWRDLIAHARAAAPDLAE